MLNFSLFSLDILVCDVSVVWCVFTRLDDADLRQTSETVLIPLHLNKPPHVPNYGAFIDKEVHFETYDSGARDFPERDEGECSKYLTQ